MEYQSFTFFFLFRLSPLVRAFLVFLQGLWRLLFSMNDDEGGGCGHLLPNFADGNPSSFSVKRFALSVLCMRVLINCATGRVNHNEASAQLMYASVTDFDCFQQSTLPPNFFHHFVLGLVSENRFDELVEGIFQSAFHFGCTRDEKV